MDWEMRLALLETAELQELYAYLSGQTETEKLDRDTLLERILHGKKRMLFQLMDKSAYKTLKRLVRHPDRPVRNCYYPVDQLLTLHMIEEIPTLERKEQEGWYQIREEAMPLAKQLARARHYDELMEQNQRADELLLGLFHTYGLLELQQCVAMLAAYEITWTAEQLLSRITWRLSIREYLQAFSVKQGKQRIYFIMLRGLDFTTTYQGIRSYPEEAYELCDEAELRSRKDRYFALEQLELKQLSAKLLHAFSRHFVHDALRELIEAQQYHTTTLLYEAMILRVFEPDDIMPWLIQAKEVIPDIYRKGHQHIDPS